MVAGRAQRIFASEVKLTGGLEIGSSLRQRNFPWLPLLWTHPGYRTDRSEPCLLGSSGGKGHKSTLRTSC